MSRVSIHIKPIPGSGFARVRTWSNGHLETDWVRPVDARLLEGIHLPVEYRASTAVALIWLIEDWDVASVTISNTSDGWRAEVDLFFLDQACFGCGRGPTPVDAIRAAKLDARNKTTY